MYGYLIARKSRSGRYTSTHWFMFFSDKSWIVDLEFIY